MLFRLAERARERSWQSVVISLTSRGHYASRLEDLAVPVHTLHLRPAVFPLGFIRLIQLLRRIRPDVVQTWMYHADLIGGVAARMSGIAPVLWNVRGGLRPRESTLSTRLTARAAGTLSHLVPSRIISCSRRNVRDAEAVGYAPDRIAVIPNGYDTEALQRSPAARRQLRDEWGVGDHEVAVGFVARWHPQKDHKTLIRAVSLLENRDAVRLILVGPGMSPNNRDLMTLLRSHSVVGRTVLPGPMSPIAPVMSALDLHVLSSISGEGFPNVVAEAMACETPCVVTDVGDAALIVGETGWVVQPDNPEALAGTISEAIGRIILEGEELGGRCRERIRSNFSLERMVQSYVLLWEEALRRQTLPDIPRAL